MTTLSKGLELNNDEKDRVTSVVMHPDDIMVESLNFNDTQLLPTVAHSFASFQRLLNKFRESNKLMLDESTLILHENFMAFADIPFEEAIVRMDKAEGQIVDLRSRKTGIDWVL